MKFKKVKIPTEMYHSHLKHCIRALTSSDSYDNFFNGLLYKLSDTKFIMRDINESKVSIAKINTHLGHLSPIHYMDMEVLNDIYFTIILANRNYKDYRKHIIDSVNEFTDIDITEYTKKHEVVLKYAENDFTNRDYLDYILYYSLGIEIDMKREIPNVELASSNPITQMVFNALNRILFTGNCEPTSYAELLHVMMYVECVAQLRVFEKFPLLEGEKNRAAMLDRIPTMMSCIKEFEKSVIDTGYPKYIRDKVNKLQYNELKMLCESIKTLTESVAQSFKDTVKLSCYTYKFDNNNLNELLKSYCVNPLMMCYLATQKYKAISKGNVTKIQMTLQNCIELVNITSTNQYFTHQTVVAKFENDNFVKSLCSQVCESTTENVDELKMSYETLIGCKNHIISDLNTELSDVKTKLSNYNLKDVSQKDTIIELKKELVDMQSRLAQAESERDFFKSAFDCEIEQEVEEELIQPLEEVDLEKYISNFPNLKVAVVTRNSHLLTMYDNIPNIKVVNGWSTQFDTRPVKEADIVIIQTLQLDHSITYRVKRALSVNAKVFFTRNSNIDMINNFIIKIVSHHGNQIAN